MQIFVAGATGVLGRRVVPTLTARGDHVRAVARTPAKAAWLRDRGAEPVGVDLFDPRTVNGAVAGSDAVVNLATAIPPTSRMLWPPAWEETNRLRTDASRNLVDAALSAGAARYVQESLAFVYPDHGSEWIDEDADPDVPPTLAGVAAAEEQARRFTRVGGAGIALRFGLLYSADSPQVRVLLTSARRGWLPVPGHSDAYQSWVHADDAADAVVAALDGLPGGAYHVVEDEPLPNAAHVEVLGSLVGRRVRQLPARVAVGALALQARSQRIANRRLRSVSGWRPRHPSRREGWPRVLAELERPRARERSNA